MTRDYAILEEVKATKSQVLNCLYSRWYDMFKENTFKSTVIAPLPQEFLEYLSSESIKLPKEDKPVVEVTSDNEYSDWEDEEQDGDPVEHFEELHERIKEVIKRYKSVCPKLNWSAPKDSTWMMINRNMKCDNASDVYLLLNSSDHITHDLDHPFEDTYEDVIPEFDYELVLRKWQDVNPALEFRVFVKNGIVIGKSQRDLNYYDYLDKLVKDNKINEMINDFVYDVVVPKFPNKDFIIDVYIPRPFLKVYIIDINPFLRVADSLLYTWSELMNDKEDNIRLITSTNLARFKTKAYSESQVPLDVIQASQDPNSLAELAKEWQINEKD